jgi:uncharacterized membrane protein
MRSRHALQIILAIGLFGVAFSGALSYQEVFGHATAVCPSPGRPGTVLGYPACIYGFFMYLLVASTALWGLTGARARRDSARAGGVAVATR